MIKATKYEFYMRGERLSSISRQLMPPKTILGIRPTPSFRRRSLEIEQLLTLARMSALAYELFGDSEN